MKRLNVKNSNQFICRLRHQVNKCILSKVGNEIREQIIPYCSSVELSKRYLEKIKNQY
jgi:hypothetical protein